MLHEELPPIQDNRHIYSVSELNQLAKELLETSLPNLWLEGEISNLAQPSSGHIYLTIKDKTAQLRAAMFKGRNRTLNFKPANGLQVLVKGRLSIYAPRGDYQLIIDDMEEAGLGALQRAYEQLKTKLQQEGLFDDHLKQPLPPHPQVIGVITSPTGAAIQDILSVLGRRFPLTRIIVYPAAVQGAEAPEQLRKALARANERNECDVLILGRGGGSLEDLWAFNDEALARDIAASALPIVSAVGHQIDFTIADFVADARAPTPSAAAELLSQDQDELLATLQGFQNGFSSLILQRIKNAQQQLAWLSKQLKHPGKRLEEHAQRLDELEQRLITSIRLMLHSKTQDLKTASANLRGATPGHKIAAFKIAVANLNLQLQRQLQQQLKDRQLQMAHLAQRLDTVSPLATLSRGYAIAQTDAGHVIQNATSVSVGDQIHVKVAKGEIQARVIGATAAKLGS